MLLIIRSLVPFLEIVEQGNYLLTRELRREWLARSGNWAHSACVLAIFLRKLKKSPYERNDLRMCDDLRALKTLHDLIKELFIERWGDGATL
jgi:hypothetical protein